MDLILNTNWIKRGRSNICLRIAHWENCIQSDFRWCQLPMEKSDFFVNCQKSEVILTENRLGWSVWSESDLNSFNLINFFYERWINFVSQIRKNNQRRIELEATWNHSNRHMWPQGWSPIINLYWPFVKHSKRSKYKGAFSKSQSNFLRSLSFFHVILSKYGSYVNSVDIYRFTALTHQS